MTTLFKQYCFIAFLKPFQNTVKWILIGTSDGPLQNQLHLVDQLLYNGPKTNESAYDWRDALDQTDELMRNVQKYMEVNSLDNISRLFVNHFILIGCITFHYMWKKHARLSFLLFGLLFGRSGNILKCHQLIIKIIVSCVIMVRKLS